jgi:tetratricopeptide (TPR) repeat protein
MATRQVFFGGRGMFGLRAAFGAIVLAFLSGHVAPQSLVGTHVLRACDGGGLYIKEQMAKLSSVPSGVNVANSQTHSYEQARRIVEEEGRLERALENWEKGAQSLASSEYHSAVKYFKVVSLLVPNMAEGHCKLGFSYLKALPANVTQKHTETLGKARDAFLKAVSKNDRLSSLDVLIGHTLSLMGEKTEACKYYKSAETKDGKVEEGLLGVSVLGLAECAVNDNNVGLATSILKNGIGSMAPSAVDVTMYVRLGNLLCFAENWEEGTKNLEKATRMAPKSATIQLSLGDCHDKHAQLLSQYSQQADTSEIFRIISRAISHYQQATWLNDKLLKAHLKLGVLFAKEQRYKEAHSHSQKAVLLSSEQSDLGARKQSLALMADVLVQQGNDKAAKVYLIQLLELYSEGANAQIEPGSVATVEEKLADVLSRRNSPVAAALHMRSVIRVKNQDARTYSKFARFLLFAGKVDEAIEVAQRSVWIDDRCWECYATLAMVQVEEGSFAVKKVLDTLSTAEQFLHSSPSPDLLKSRELHLLKGSIHAALRQWSQAIDSFKACISDGSGSKGYFPSEIHDLVQGICLNNLAVVRVHTPGPNVDETMVKVRTGLNVSFHMVPKGCEEPEYSIKNNLGIVHLEEGNEGIEAVDRASTVQLRNAFGFWVCSRKYSGSTGDLGPFVPLVLRLNPGKIGSSVMKNINGILMSQKQSSGSWMSWMTGMVHSIVGQKKPKNVTKPKAKNSIQQPIGGNGPSIAGIDSQSFVNMPAMVVPGQESNSKIEPGLAALNIEGGIASNGAPPQASMSDGEYFSIIQRAKGMEERGEWARAAAAYENAVLGRKRGMNDVSAAVYHAFGRTAHLSGDTAKAVALFDEAIYLVDEATKTSSPSLTPQETASLLADAGIVHADQGNLQRAANLYVAAIDADPSGFDAYYRLAQLLAKDKQPEMAITIYYRLLKAQAAGGGFTSRALTLLMNKLFSSNRCAEAVLFYRELRSIEKRVSFLKADRLASNLVECGEVSEAIDFIRSVSQGKEDIDKLKYVKLLSSLIKEQAAIDDAQKHVNSAMENKGLVDGAEVAINIAPENRKWAFMNEIASVYAFHGYSDKAELYLRQSIALRPTTRSLLELAEQVEGSNIAALDIDQLTELVRLSESVLKTTPIVTDDLPTNSSIPVFKQLGLVRNKVGTSRKLAWQRIVRVLAFLGNWEEAKKQCEIWLNESPQDIVALSSLIEIYMKGIKNSMHTAVGYLQKATEQLMGQDMVSNALVKSDIDTLLQVALDVGTSDINAQMYERGIESLHLARSMASRAGVENHEVYVRSSELEAHAYFLQGDLEKAEKILLEFFYRETGNGHIKRKLTFRGLRLLGDVYKQRADSGEQDFYHMAIGAYRKAINATTAKVDGKLYYMLGSSLLKNGTVLEASQVLAQALALQPDDSHINNNLGVALYQLGRKDEAQKLIERSIKIDDGCHSRFNLGAFLDECGEVRAAARHFRHAIRMCRKARKDGDLEAIAEVEIQLRLAKTIVKDPHGNYDAAVALYKDALRHFRSASNTNAIANTLSELGSLLSELERHTESIEFMYESMELRTSQDNETRLQARIDYGNSLLRAGHLREARNQYEIVLKGAPHHPTVFNNLGVVAYREQDFKGAMEWFKKALVANPDHLEAKLALQQITPNGPRWDLARVSSTVMGHNGKSTTSFNHED